MDEIINKAKGLLSSKKAAYERVFSGIDADTRIVLEDLADFCRANKTTFHEDPRIHALLEGRKEVWLRIQKYLNLSPEKLWELQRKD